MDSLDSIVQEASAAIAAATDNQSLDSVRVAYLGKKGKVTGLLKALGKLPKDQRPQAGVEINKAKVRLLDAINVRRENMADELLLAQLAQEKIDVTLPGRDSSRDTHHEAH